MIPLRDSAPSHRLPLITYTLVVFNIVVFFFELTSADFEALVFRYGLVASQISFRDISTLLPFLTSQFLHAGFLHLLSNLWFLKIFGDSVEAVLGWLRFAVFYLSSGLVAGLTQYLVSPSSGIPMIGASGAVAGVLGAYFVYFPRHRIETLVPTFGFWQVVNLPAAFMLFYWFVIQLLSGVVSLGMQGAVGGVAFFAHAGGFAAGYVLARASKRRTEFSRFLG